MSEKYVFTEDMVLPQHPMYVKRLLEWVDADPSRHNEYLRYGDMAFSIEHPFAAETTVVLHEVCNAFAWSSLRQIKKEVWNILLTGWEDYCEEKRELFRERYPLESLGNTHVQD